MHQSNVPLYPCGCSLAPASLCKRQFRLFIYYILFILYRIPIINKNEISCKIRMSRPDRRRAVKRRKAEAHACEARGRGLVVARGAPAAAGRATGRWPADTVNVSDSVSDM